MKSRVWVGVNKYFMHLNFICGEILVIVLFFGILIISFIMFFHILDEIGSHFSWNSLCRHWRAVWAWWKPSFFLPCLSCCWTVTATLQAGWAAARTSSPSCVVHFKLDLPTMHKKPTIRYYHLEGSNRFGTTTYLYKKILHYLWACSTFRAEPCQKCNNVIREPADASFGLLVAKTSNTKWRLAHLLSHLS